MIKVYVTSILVDDQQKALKFYTEKAGFVKKNDIPMGEDSWLTVVPPSEEDGVEILLEPASIEPSRVFQKALKERGIPWTSLEVDDLDEEYKRMTELGVEFSVAPQDAGSVRLAVFDDTCGNYIQLVQML